MSLAAYLAANYLTADSSNPTKKRKRKAREPSGLIIADDDDSGWATQTIAASENGPMISSSRSAEFRKAKKSAWKNVDDADARAADAIIAGAAAENSAAAQQDEEPVLEENAGDEEIVKMGDGTHAGLQTAAAVAAQMEAREREERARWEKEMGGKKKGGAAEETVYRDATGRRIDISMRRAEARREAYAKAAEEKKEKEAQGGDVQGAARAKRREELDEARFMPVARGVDDEEMNQELKGRDRWNDPAAQFLSDKKGKGVSVSGMPIYQGAAMPNRYGIRPGHRWDGVDRGNGWEGEIFKARNRRTRNKDLDFAWQTDT